MRSIVAALLLAACATPAPQPEVTPAVNCHPEVAGSETPGIVAPVVLHKEPPKTPYYPSGHRIVEMDAIIDQTGQIIEVCPIRGERDFFDAAERALRNWRFKPATLDGKPVPFRFHFTTRFGSS